MKKILLFLSVFLLSVASAAAQWSSGSGNTGYGGCGMMGGFGGGGYWMWLAGAVYFIVAAFVFSAIFWLVYNWLVKQKKR